MGQEESTLIDENIDPFSLKARDLPSVASYCLSSKCQRIVVLTGAGISTSAGIPDFRSPETGLYANLARLNLPYAEAVFSIEYFRENPDPFYTLAHELYPGKYRPTITHSFIYLLHKKGLLLKHFTQNIDCLDREAGVPGDKVIEAHGSFATQRCIDCKTTYPDDKMREHVAEKKIPRCVRGECNGLVKPDIVFFGEALPTEFFMNRNLVTEADLVIVLGTSLTVQPFASLPSMAGAAVPRLLINLEQVGGLGSRPDDVLLLEDCDNGVRRLADALGWRDELEELWAYTGMRFGAEPPVTTANAEGGAERTADEKLQDEVDKLTKEIDETLKLNKDHDDKARSDVEAKVEKDVTGDEKGTAIASLSTTSGNADSKPNAVLESKPDAIGTKADAAGGASDGDLSHIFPHAEKKSSL
jgi:NAD-dependent histone deacetylase SIR2